MSSFKEDADCVVIGAGVVGLAIARRLAESGRDVIILESADIIGSETSSRNSEVIHAGLYYPTGSLKARLCVGGKALLYRYCQEHGIPYKRCMKLVVATSEKEIPALKRVQAKAAENGVTDLEWLDKATALKLEPNLACEAALLSPSTGQVDAHSLMLSYLGDAEAAGAMIAYLSPVEGGSLREGSVEVRVGGESPMILDCRTVINAAGLHAQSVARGIEGLREDLIPPQFLNKGCYFSIEGLSPFTRLIYPVPDKYALGIHATLDLSGRCRFGPDSRFVEKIDYSLDDASADKFYESIRRYWPGLPDGALHPDYSGIRPKIAHGGVAIDFMIQGPEVHGHPGLVNLFGIESPGLTSSLAIAEEVTQRLSQN